MPTIQLSRVHGDFGFEATDENGHTIKMDSSPESGGLNYGVRPMQSLLMALGGCSAIDVISILKKQRQDVVDYKMTISGEREKARNHHFGKLSTSNSNYMGILTRIRPPVRLTCLSINIARLQPL